MAILQSDLRKRSILNWIFYRHNAKSDLHRTNLESWKRRGRSSSSSGAQQEQSQQQQAFSAGRYRDRAKERRQKYGIDDEGPKPNRLKEKYLAAMEEAEFTSKPGEVKKLDSSNIGSKMLQKMGWKEGLGLGKTNQGRTEIIEVNILSPMKKKFPFFQGCPLFSLAFFMVY